MNLLLHKFKTLGLGVRVFSEADFYSICEKENIRVIEIDEPFSFWLFLNGKSYIILHKRLRGYKLLFTMFHELAHHFLHHGNELHAVEAFNSNNSKNEYEADLFATIAIYPYPAILSGELTEYEEFDRYLCKIRRDAERIYFLAKDL